MRSLDYRPAGWLPGPNLMTAYGSVLLPRPHPPFRRERWELRDQDFLDVDRLEGKASGAPLVLICHGLEGSSRAAYVRGLSSLAQGRGLSVAALCFRSCSGEENRLPRLYHSGETGDLALAVERLASEEPGRPLLLAGFSLGGNVIVKYLGERGEAVPKEVAGAAVVSVPFDLALCARTLDGPGFWNRVYRTRFLHTLRKKALGKARRFPGLLDPEAVRAARTFAAFDASATARLHGFASADDYWARSSSGPLVGRVRRPLLILSAKDDPLVPFRSLPTRAARANPLVTLLTPERGGHVGFVSGGPLRPRCWAEERVVEYLAALCRG